MMLRALLPCPGSIERTCLTCLYLLTSHVFLVWYELLVRLKCPEKKTVKLGLQSQSYSKLEESETKIGRVDQEEQL